MSYDSDVVLATSGRGEADWDKIITLCNRIRNSFGASSMQFALESVMKRLKNTDPNVQLHALTLLEACVSNCGSDFQIELTKPFFQSEVKALLGAHPDPKVSQRLRELLASWVAEFRSNAQMKGLLTFVEQLRHEGHSFAAAQPQLVQPLAYPVDSSATASKEDSDLQKAIKMSLEESKKPSAAPSTATLSSVYPVLTSPKPQKKQQQQGKKVRALYDFHAAEDNELSFRAGEIITILDDSDENWWKGESHLGKGLFPANFVTLNLNSEPEQVKVEKESKKKKEEPKRVMANEDKVDLLLQMLSTADATIESSSENDTIVELEKECQAMKPSIDEAIASLQRQEDDMKSVNEKFQEAMAYYRKLLAEGPRLSTMQSQRVTTAQQYQAPPQQYQAMPQQYQAPPQQYQAPPQQYQGPSQQYQATPQAPSQQYQAPPQQYQAPPQQYQVPPQQYGATPQAPPSQQYQATSQAPPSQQFQVTPQAPPPQQYQAPPQQLQAGSSVQPSHSLSGGSYQPTAMYSATPKVAPPISSSSYLGEMTSLSGPPPQYTPYASMPPSGSGPSSANQPLMTGSSSMNQAPMTGLNQQPMVSSMSQAFPVTQSLMMGVPPMSQQPMMGQLPGQPSFNQSVTTGANSLQHLPHLPYAYYQASPAAHQPPHPSLLH
ncbi:hypothetical protein EMCRGX_G014898 [Ephydatia muelleri]|eukprot:Em0005g1063a